MAAGTLAPAASWTPESKLLLPTFDPQEAPAHTQVKLLVSQNGPFTGWWSIEGGVERGLYEQYKLEI